MFRFGIILLKSFANLPGRHSDNWVGIRVVGWLASKGENADTALLDLVHVSFERLLDDVSQQHRVAPAVYEERMLENTRQLTANRIRFQAIRRSANIDCR